MNTIVLTKEARGERTSGAWLRDLGFKLIEAGCEINITRAEGDAARELLARYGMEVVHVMEAFDSKVAAKPQTRAGTTANADGERVARMPSHSPHERYGGTAEGGSPGLS